MSGFGVQHEAKNPGQATTVGAASTELFAENLGRAWVYVYNSHATQRVTLRLSNSAANGGAAAVDLAGIVVPAGQGVYVENYVGAIQAIANGAATTISVVEV